MFRLLVYSILGAMPVLAACTAATSELPNPTITAVPPSTLEPTPEATPVWFPPTPTHTPFPTTGVTPTAEINLDLGPELFRDNFDNSSAWEPQISPEGASSLANQELAIVVTEPQGFYFTVRRTPDLRDFYLEVTASPALCVGLDEYGIMLRFASEGDYYRYSFSCDGQVRLDRIYRSGAAALVDWVPGAGVPPGAPSSVRMGVWVRGDEMLLFADGLEQFTVSDPLIPEGRIGLFARSANETAVTIGFSDLVVYELAGALVE
jgi:hypothetical protein